MEGKRHGAASRQIYHLPCPSHHQLGLCNRSTLFECRKRQERIPHEEGVVLLASRSNLSPIGRHTRVEIQAHEYDRQLGGYCNAQKGISPVYHPRGHTFTEYRVEKGVLLYRA